MIGETISCSPIAHSKNSEGKEQYLLDHLTNVAAKANLFAEKFDSGALAEWLGWWHDAGKIAPDVQAYLKVEMKAARGPDHSSAGMLVAYEVFEPLAFNIAGHHGGLLDSGTSRIVLTQKKERATRV